MEKLNVHEIPGFLFGQIQDLEAGTGCTVILCPNGAITGVDVRGGSPGTRDTDALDPLCHREAVHGVVLTGGSAFGLDAAGGVMKKLEEEGKIFVIRPLIPTVSRMEKDYDKLQHFYMHGNRLMKKEYQGLLEYLNE